jgi:hypothetical protein
MLPVSERTRERVAVGCLIALLCALGFFYAQLPLAGDHGYYSFGAWRMTAGQVPYRDVGCYDAPGIYAIHLLAHSTLGWNAAGLRWFDVAWMVATVAVVFEVARRLGSRFAAWLAVALAMGVYVGLGYRETAQRDSFPILFTLGALLLALRVPVGVRACVALGACTAGVFWLKPPTILVCAPALLSALFGGAFFWRDRVRRAGAMALGFAAVSAPFLLYFAAEGALAPLAECMIEYSAVYSTVRYAAPLHARFFADFLLASPIALAAGAGLVAGRRERGIALLGWCTLAAIANVSIQGKLTIAHTMPLWFLLAIGAALAVGRAFDAARSAAPRRRRVLQAAAWIALLAMGVQVVSMHRQQRHGALLAQAWRKGSLQIEREDVKVARYVASRTDPGDGVVVWGTGAGLIYFAARRPCPTRFLQAYPFASVLRDTPLVVRWKAEYLEALRRAPPRYFVVMGNDAFPNIRNLDSEQALRDWSELSGWLAAHYREEARMGGRYTYRILRLAEASPDPQSGKPER